MGRLSDAARKYAGVPFRRRGRSPKALDCAGLGWIAYRDCGHELPDYRLYSREPANDGLVTHLTAALGEPVHVAPVRLADLQADDVIVVRSEVQPHHVAILGSHNYAGTEALTMIHADGLEGHVHEQRLTPDVIERITHVFRKPV